MNEKQTNKKQTKKMYVVKEIIKITLVLSWSYKIGLMTSTPLRFDLITKISEEPNSKGILVISETLEWLLLLPPQNISYYFKIQIKTLVISHSTLFLRDSEF